ncbi:MAG: Crp/Fnr family transcriptional regulator [Sphingomicrobium sp.]
MISAHFKKLRRRISISSEEERGIRGLVSETRRVRSDETVVRAGEELSNSLLLIDGWLARSKDFPGGERQVTELHVAGDFADLHSFTLKRLDHDLVTMSECTIAIVPHERLGALIAAHPRLGRAYWFLTNIDAAIQREWALSLGQRSALSRMAHLFCELFVRLEVVGRTVANRYDLPLTQRELSECLGLTVVHANRTIQELRRRGLIELENRQLTILDRRGLEGVAQFDPTYLHLDKHEL